MPGFVIGGIGGPAPIVPNNRDWLRSNRFQLIDFLGQVPMNNTITASDKSSEFIALRDVAMGDKKIKSFDVKTPGTTYKFANQAEFSNMKMVFYGSRMLLSKCLQMADRVHNTRDGIRDYQDYKGSIKFRVLDKIGLENVGGGDGVLSQLASLTSSVLNPRISNGLEYLYKNAWISHVQHGQVSYSSSEIMMITTMIEFDFFEVRRLDSDSVSGDSITANSDDVASLLNRYNGDE